MTMRADGKEEGRTEILKQREEWKLAFICYEVTTDGAKIKYEERKLFLG